METTASSMAMEVRAATEALRFLSENRHRKAVIVYDSMSMLQKVKKGLLYADWFDLISQSQLQSVTWLFCPGHSGVHGNERADKLAGDAVTGDKLTFDSPLVLSTVRDYLQSTRPETSSHTMKILQEKKSKLVLAARTCYMV